MRNIELRSTSASADVCDCDSLSVGDFEVDSYEHNVGPCIPGFVDMVLLFSKQVSVAMYVRDRVIGFVFRTEKRMREWMSPTWRSRLIWLSCSPTNKVSCLVRAMRSRHWVVFFLSFRLLTFLCCVACFAVFCCAVVQRCVVLCHAL